MHTQLSLRTISLGTSFNRSHTEVKPKPVTAATSGTLSHERSFKGNGRASTIAFAAMQPTPTIDQAPAQHQKI